MFTLPQLTAAFQHNPILTGGIGLSIGASALAYVKSIPGFVSSFVKRLFVSSINIESSDRSYQDIAEWLHYQESVQKTKLLSANTIWKQPTDESDGKYIVGFSPAPGSHILRYRGRRIWLNHTRKDAKEGGLRPPEELTFTCLGFTTHFLREMISEAMLYVWKKRQERSKLMSVYMQSVDCWTEFTCKKPRSIDTVTLPAGIKEGLIGDLQTFLESERRYYTMGIPFHRGYLLYGPPGNGKSSITEAIAGHFHMDLYVLSLSAPNFTDATLLQLVTRVPQQAILLIEDIDAAFVKRQHIAEVANSNAPMVTFSGLLNALDGVASKHGQIIFMSTNHLEKLDPALLRPGRCDYKVLIDNATPQQASDMFTRFYPESDLGDVFGSRLFGKTISMAMVQNHLHCAGSPEAAIRNEIEPLDHTIKVSQIASMCATGSGDNSEQPSLAAKELEAARAEIKAKNLVEAA